jgi:cytochrome b involved in lipid metabolism
MSETKEFTYQDVAEHNTKKDCYLVIHDKVYDCGKFVDEHPYVPRLREFDGI